MHKVIIRIVAFICITQTMMSCKPAWVMQERKRRFKEQIGTYILSLELTDFGPYAKDSARYKNLTITFKADSTFFLNMDVPFLQGRIGVWETSEGNPDFNINTLFFSNDKNLLDNEFHSQGEQFSQVGKDSVFQLHSATPKKNNEPVYDIYFKKIK